MNLLEKTYKLDKLRFQNVVSKKYKFHYSEMEKYYQDFVFEIVKAGHMLKGPYFYAIENLPTDEFIEVEMFFPIFEEKFALSDFKYSSYFEVQSLLKIVVKEEFESIEWAYAQLLEFIDTNDLEISTPFYHIFPRSERKYVELYVGCYEEAIEIKNQRLDENSFGF